MILLGLKNVNQTLRNLNLSFKAMLNMQVPSRQWKFYSHRNIPLFPSQMLHNSRMDSSPSKCNFMSALYIYLKLYSTTFRSDFFVQIGQSKWFLVNHFMRWSDAFTTPAPALSGSASIGLAVDSAGFLGSALGKFFSRDSFLAALAVLFSTRLGNANTLPPANWVASAGTELFSKVAPWRDQLHQTIQVNRLCGATGTEENQ